MGKLNASLLQHLRQEDLALLAGVETGMKNHELVPASLAIALSKVPTGGCHRILRELCKNRLLTYERGKKYDGYRLTNLGYDYLALDDLRKRNVIFSFGNQIGVGKESNVYTVANNEDEELCLKLHRLGRICFRKVTEKRDYHKRAKSLSWLYLSKLSATKEFAYMKALYDEGFPVPKPISFNRHCVVMELIKGTLLNHILELQNPGELYDRLMELILRLGACGLIHGDFNEFNIMVTEDEKPVLIDFPQMLSTEHPDAEMYFDRDVNCVKTFFRRRFKYETDHFYKLSDVDRVCYLDAQVHTTGFTKEMAKHLNVEMGIESERGDNSDDDEKEVADSSISVDVDEKEVAESSISADVVEKEVAESSISVDVDTSFSNMHLEESEYNHQDSSDERFSDADGISVTSTIKDPSEVKRILKQEIKKKKTRQAYKGCRAKGEACATRRSRVKNANEIKHSQYIWEI